MTGSRAVAIAIQASQVAPSRKLGTSCAKARAKVEAGRNHSKMARKVIVFRARVVLADSSRIRAADSLGTATSAARQATEQPTAHKREECKP